MIGLFQRYLRQFADLTSRTTAIDGNHEAVCLESCVAGMGESCRAAHDAGGKVMFIGNGGSAGVCSHMAIDFSKNGGIRSVVFTDGSALTCLSNDFGFENVFSEQVALHGKAGDVLIAVSSSGRSANILKAAEVARQVGISLFTFSGFDADNPLRRMGEYNLHIPSHEYGMVEVGHQLILHAVLDIEMSRNSLPALAAAAR